MQIGAAEQTSKIAPKCFLQNGLLAQTVLSRHKDPSFGKQELSTPSLVSPPHAHPWLREEHNAQLKKQVQEHRDRNLPRIHHL